MKKRISAIILSLVLAVTLFTPFASALTASQAADVDGDGAVTARDAAIMSRYLANWSDYRTTTGAITYPWKDTKTTFSTSNSPADFGGRTFRFLVPAQTSSNAGHFSYLEVKNPGGTTVVQDGTTFYFTNLTKLNQAVATRNAYLEERYNCHVDQTIVPIGEYADVLRAAQISGSHDFDYAMIRASQFFSSGYNAYFTNLNGVSTINLNASWFDKEYNKSATLLGTLYGVAGDATCLERSSYMLYTSDYAIGVAGSSVAELQEMILSGNWTVDNFVNLALAGKTNGLNYAVTSEYQMSQFLMTGAGINLGQKHSGTGRVAYYDSLTSLPNFTAVWDALGNVMVGTNHSTSGRPSNATTAASATFSSHYLGSMATFSATYLGSGKNLLIVPYPVATAGASYRGAVFTNIYSSSSIGIPVTVDSLTDGPNYGFRNGKEMLGYFLSAYFEASSNHAGTTSVRLSFLEDLKNSKAISSTAAKNFNKAIIDQCIAKKIVFAYNYQMPTGSSSTIFSGCNTPEKWSNVFTTYTAALEAIRRDAEYYCDYYEFDSAFALDQTEMPLIPIENSSFFG